MDDKLLRLQAVMEMTSMKRAKLYAMMAVGKFPKAVKIDGCAVWRESVIEKWMDINVPIEETASQATVQ